MMKQNTNIPTWIDPTLYPFKHHYLQLDAGKMHYIDEGEGPIILFIHGTPTWSFLYRGLIQKLSAHYRCIAIDHLGFGLSENAGEFQGTPEFHAQNLSEFIRKLNLQKITLVVHDFGGPIGLAAAIEQAERIEKVVLFNSWLWATAENKDAQKIDKIVNSWLGKFLYLNMNFSPKVLLKKGFTNKAKLTKEIHQHYIKPFPTKRSRLPLLHIGQALVGSSDWYQKQWEQLDRLSDKSWLILWGMQDEFITKSYLKKWEKRLPNAEKQEFDCGHFVQEETTEGAIKAIDGFMSGK